MMMKMTAKTIMTMMMRAVVREVGEPVPRKEMIV